MASLNLFRGAKLVFRQFAVTGGIKRVGVAGARLDHLIFIATSVRMTHASSRRCHRGVDVSQEQLDVTQVRRAHRGVSPILSFLSELQGDAHARQRIL